MQENPRIKMIREKIIHNCKHPIQFIGKTVRGTLGTANIIKNAAFKTITYDLSSPAEQRVMQSQLQNQYDNLIQTVKEIAPGQLDTFVSDVIADMATLKIFNVIAQSDKDIASQASSSRNAPGTAITPRPDQLPAVSRCAKKETPIITSKHLAAQRLLQDQQRAPQASTSHANSSGPQASTSASKNVDKGKYPANKPAAVEDKGKFKGTTEEPAKRTGQVEQPNHEAHNAANYEKLKKDLLLEKKPEHQQLKNINPKKLNNLIKNFPKQKKNYKQKKKNISKNTKKNKNKFVKSTANINIKENMSYQMSKSLKSGRRLFLMIKSMKFYASRLIILATRISILICQKRLMKIQSLSK